ncbi:hypothetical protein D3C80_1007610 [compost metagenome]
MAAVGGTFEAALAILQRLFGGDGVQHHGHGPGYGRKGRRQALARRLALGRVGVAEAVQPLGQGQPFLARLGAQHGQGLVEQARPLSLDRPALGDEGLQFGRQLIRLHRPHPAQPRRPAGGGRMGGQRRRHSRLLQGVDLQRQPDGRRGDGRQLLAHVGLEPLRRRILAVGRGGQEGVGAQGPHHVRRLLIKPDRLVQRAAQLGARQGGQPPLPGVHLIHQRLGPRQIGGDARVLARGVEVGQVPQRGVGEFGRFDGRVHGLGCGEAAGAMQPSFFPSPDGRRWPEGPDEGSRPPSAQAVAQRLTPTERANPHPFAQERSLTLSCAQALSHRERGNLRLSNPRSTLPAKLGGHA